MDDDDIRFRNKLALTFIAFACVFPFFLCFVEVVRLILERLL